MTAVLFVFVENCMSSGAGPRECIKNNHIILYTNNM